MTIEHSESWFVFVRASQDAGLQLSDVARSLPVYGGSAVCQLFRTWSKSMTGKQPNMSISGAGCCERCSCSSGVLTGGVSSILLLDVTPLSLGVETLGGVEQRSSTCTTSQLPAQRFTQLRLTSGILTRRAPEMASDLTRALVAQPAAFLLLNAVSLRLRSPLTSTPNGILKVTAKDKATDKSPKSPFLALRSVRQR